ncbi:MAG TPA: rod shape-determining protein MreC [Solirubrobacteraceae bacterium]|nr:rod shape-determining protein MreC [Solirubrobacteraceae bacterium]
MYDKQVRRRRAVLAALVACCILLLTVYFTEPSNGGLHATQRGAMEVLAPVQEGANRALKPFRDLFGWFGDTLDAKEERDALRKERDTLRQEVARLELERAENEELRGLLSFNRTTDYQPVTARVYVRSPSTWYSTVQINKGASDGVRVNQPVVNGAGLVGKVKSVSDGNAVVMLLTDQQFGVAAQAVKAREPGAVLPAVGAPGDLLLDLVPRAKRVKPGDQVITAGTVSERLSSPFPRGLLIGTVKRIEGDGELDRTIHVEPAADLRRLDIVQVLTRPTAELTASAASPGGTP